MNNEQRRIAAQQHFDALPSIEELLQEAEALRPALGTMEQALTEKLVVPCVYTGQEGHQGVGTHQCPKCKRWYCEVCHEETFLCQAKIAGQITTLPEPICAECHYKLFWRSALERDRAM